MTRPSVPPPLVDGQLPHGRWVCTEGEVKAAYVDGQPGDREEIWREWQQVTGVLRGIVGEVPACWMSGSFFTNKPNPADIDCVYIVDGERFLRAVRADPQDAAILNEMVSSRVRERYGLRVDCYVLPWVPTPGTEIPAHTKNYLHWRGYWDNLWCRVRDNDPRLDSIPRRGYLEVQLDGYE